MSKYVNCLENLRKIRLVAFDVDGVLTDCRLYYNDQGECMKVFNAKDGIGVRMLNKLGIDTAIITRRVSGCITKRAEDIGIKYVFQGVMDKIEVFDRLCKDLGVNYDECAYMGDDIIDICVLEKVGVKSCPKDALPSVLSLCNFISEYVGGMGCARELCNAIVLAKTNNAYIEF